MSTAKGSPTRLEQWQHPVTGERVTLTFDGSVTRMERSGSSGGAPTNGEALRWEPGAEFSQWNPLLLGALRDQAQAGATSEEERTRRVTDLGFPPELWEELDAFQHEQGLFALPPSGVGQSEVPAGYRSSLTVTTQELPPQPSLLRNPTPEMQRRFAELVAGLVQASAPPDTALHQQGQELQRQGFVRLSARRPGGSLWLPPALEPYRQEMERWARPVVRPAVVPGTPEPWQSKLGGVPYRPRGAAWPKSLSGDPMYFLAQINLKEANAQGDLSELPRHGLLQFFLVLPSSSYKEVQRRPELGEPAVEVLYWPEVQQDEAALTREVPEFSEELMHEEFNPPERALAFLNDREFPSLLDDRLAGVHRAVPGLESSDMQPNGHRLGGYAMLINAHFPAEEDWRLLFQFDGDDMGEQIYGGDALSGWLGFFIRAEDLARLDLTRVRLELDAS